jgi:dihydrodipicolinate synthase/N-acetylneuraminate lyase
MAHVGHHVFAETVELCEHALAHGVDFGIAINPYYPPTGSVRAWYRALADASSLPLFLVNATYSGYTLAPELRTRRGPTTSSASSSLPATGSS